MAKRPSKHLRPARPLAAGGFASLQSRADGEWMVQTMPADAATKTYSCPGCNQSVGPGTAHVVVWPRDASIGSTSAVDERRHWHTGCWARRR
ncbi:MAG TPA: hypothetical protein PLE12_06695 [Propionicimonas sp.]|mgnify:FL=1|jgi:hypothetical protein|nr:hypothetical protein [Propionicimonas sp.]